jgi:hypothetical protein
MRYMIVNYYRRPTGQLDESFVVAQRVKDRELQTAAVIVDFKTRHVIKASFEGAVVPKDFDRVVSYYQRHYSDHIDQLLKANGLELRSEPQ